MNTQAQEQEQPKDAAAQQPQDMNRPGWGCHALRGNLVGHWALSVSGNWRLTFAFEDGDAILVDYQDYH